MKKRTAVIAALVSVLPMGQPLVIGTGAALTSAAVMLSVPTEAYAESFQFYFNRAYNKGESGDYYGAISDYNKTLEIDPRDASAYFGRAWSKKKLKNYYGAIADYTKAIKIKPNYKSAYKNRGITKEDIGDLNGACADWREASYLGDQDSVQWVRNQC